VAPPLVLTEVSDSAGNHYNVSDVYYNLDPKDFGLSYSILQSAEEPTAAEHKRNLITLDGSGRSLWNKLSSHNFKRVTSDIPGVCYNGCNDAALEEQSMGKTPALCKSDSAFNIELGHCKKCVAHYATSSTAWSQKLLPSFAQFLDYCSGQPEVSTRSTVEKSVAKTEESTGATTSESDASTTSTGTQPTKGATIATHAGTSTVGANNDSESNDSSDPTKTTGESNSNGQHTGSVTTDGTRNGEPSNSAWTTRAATQGTASESGSAASQSGAKTKDSQDDGTSTEGSAATGDDSNGASNTASSTGSGSRTSTADSSGSGSISGSATSFAGTASAHDVVSLTSLLSFLFAVAVPLL
jgi:hypothetical protein